MTEAAIQEVSGKETQAQQPTKLLTTMATDYGMDALAFKNVLLKTVFPQDKPVTHEQLAMFCVVAHRYKLNPLIREIFAFPAKGGGVVPIVSIDGWISLVQRQANYNGHRFVYEWVDGKAGGILTAATCIISRKDLQNPIEHTEFMAECVRGTDVWRQWPRRMLTHKAFIQCARYAFGFSGIYDEDEGERILEGTLKATSGGNFQSEIAMPRRMGELPEPAKLSEGQLVAEAIKAELIQQERFEPTPELESYADTATEVRIPDPEPGPAKDLQGLFDQGLIQKGTDGLKETIGRGRAQRLYTLLNKHRVHTEVECQEKFLKPLGLTHFSDMPVELYDRACAWVEGKLERRMEDPG